MMIKLNWDLNTMLIFIEKIDERMIYLDGEISS
jgi:hypothetical protein